MSAAFDQSITLPRNTPASARRAANIGYGSRRMSKDSSAEPSALRASGSLLTPRALPSMADLQDARLDSSGDRYCKDYSIVPIGRPKTFAISTSGRSLDEPVAADGTLTNPQTPRRARRHSRLKRPHQYSSSVNKIDPEKLSTCLQVLSEVESLHPDHPDAVAVRLATAGVFKSVKRARRHAKRDEVAAADRAVIAATATGAPGRIDDETAGLPLVSTAAGASAGTLLRSRPCYTCKN